MKAVEYHLTANLFTPGAVIHSYSSRIREEEDSSLKFVIKQHFRPVGFSML